MMFKILALSELSETSSAGCSPKVERKSTYTHVNLGRFKGRELAGTLNCPFRPIPNKYGTFAEEAINEFPLKHGLMSTDDSRYATFKKARFDRLGAFVQPDDDKEGLITGVLYMGYLFDHDDDREGANYTVEQVNELNRDYLAILEGKREFSSLNTPLERALFLDVHKPLTDETRYPDKGSYVYFIHANRQYFQANEWEVNNRQLAIVPSKKDYKIYRTHTSAVLACLALALRTAGVGKNMKEVVDSHVQVQCILDKVIDIICMVNDIYSFRKEVKERVVENAIFVSLFDSLTKQNQALRTLFCPDTEDTVLSPGDDAEGVLMRKAVLEFIFCQLEGKEASDDPLRNKSDMKDDKKDMVKQICTDLSHIDFGVEIQTALSSAVQEHNHDMREFVIQKSMLQRGCTDKDILTFIGCMEKWIGGHIEWTPESLRYFQFDVK
jgi:hypothetical protein